MKRSVITSWDIQREDVYDFTCWEICTETDQKPHILGHTLKQITDKILQNTTHKPFINIASWSKQWQTNQRPQIWELPRENTDNRSWGTHPETCQIKSWEDSHKQIRDSHRQNTEWRERHSGTHTTNSSEKSHMLENTTTNPLETSHPGTYANRSDTSKPTNHTWKHRPSYRRIHPKTHQRAHVLRCTLTKILVTLTPGHAPTHRSETSIQQHTWTNGFRDLILDHTKQIRDFISHNIHPQSSPTLHMLKNTPDGRQSPQRDQRIQHFSFKSLWPLLLLSHQFLWLYFPHHMSLVSTYIVT